VSEALPCVVGVDGGGSKTACRVAGADGTLLGEASAGPSNYQTVGEAGTLAALAEATAGAVAAAARPLRAVGLCLALAGVDRPADLAAMQRVAVALLDRPAPGLAWDVSPERVEIVNDAVAALVGGTGRTAGVVCVAGTGSIAFGMNRAGARARAGGWGHLLGDEGSGYAIGLAALRAVARAADGRGPATALTDLVLARCHLDDPSGLIGLVYGGWQPADVAGFAPVVGAAAAAGDAVAGGILAEAAAELALAVATVARSLGFLDPDGFRFEVVAAGGSWSGLPGLQERFAAALRGEATGATVIAPRRSPVEGAVLLARRAAGLVVLD
jgi:N-acetylglucosamine kinase-like BadF-type ATPase